MKKKKMNRTKLNPFSIIDSWLKVLVLFLFIFPFLWMFSTSLMTLEETLAFPPVLFPESFQWSNFIEAMTSGPFLMYVKNSVIITGSIIVLQLVIGTMAAYSFARYEFKGKGILFGFVVIAFMIPHHVIFIPVYIMMSNWGLISTLLPQIIPFSANAFAIFFLRQLFKQIPNELVESAKIDGAKEFQIIWKIMVPLAMPAYATIILFSFVTHWNDYFWPLVMTDSADVRPLSIGISMLATDEGVANWHIIMAGNVVLIAPIIILYIFLSKKIIQTFAFSGLK